MLLSLLRKAEFKPFAQVLSPSFFEAVKATVLVGELSGLVSRYRDKLGFERTKLLRERAMHGAGLPVRFVDALQPGLPPPALGDVVLETYFHQVISGGPMLLDFRAEAFAYTNADVHWAPRPAYVELGADLAAPLAGLYRGYYFDDARTFDGAAKQLGLERVIPALREHFAGAANEKVRFSLSDFQRRFAAIFAACKATRSQLHPGFVSLGIALATLYSHLEQYDAAFDASRAFVRANSALERAGFAADSAL